jgi:prepilin-type processing-associated H-X9-DG protein
LSGELDAGSLDVSGDVDVDGTLETDALSINGTAVTSTAAELNALDGITAVVGELNALDIGSTAVGTAVASKAVILDSNKDYTGVRNLTISGELDAATLDISGNVDIDGVLETDNLTIGGAQGTDGQVLTSTGSGVAWENAAGGSFDPDGAVVFNDSSADVDFRVESNGNANMLFVDGGNNTVNIGSADQGAVRLGQVLNLVQTGNFGGMALTSYSTTDNNRCLIDFNKSGQATIGSHGVVADDEDLGAIVFRGDDGDEFLDGAIIQANVDGTPGNGDMPTRLEFLTTADGASSCTKRMTIDSNGNLLLGTSAFNAGSFGGSATGMVVGGAQPMVLLHDTDDDKDGFIGMAGSLMFINTADAIPIRFGTSDAERMRIASDGKTMIGATSPVVDCMLTVRGNYNNERGLGIQSTTAGGDLVMFYATAQVGTITSTGGGTNYNSASDYRLKENVNYDWDATTRLKQLKPARFNWINDETNTLIDGFLAHEVEDVVSHAVRGTKDAVDENGDVEPQSIDQSKLVPLLVKAIQEQQALIESLTARITTLEG